MIGEGTVELAQILEDVSLTKKPLVLNKKYYNDVLKKMHPDLKMDFTRDDNNRFWVKFKKKDEDGKIIN